MFKLFKDIKETIIKRKLNNKVLELRNRYRGESVWFYLDVFENNIINNPEFYNWDRDLAYVADSLLHYKDLEEAIGIISLDGVDADIVDSYGSNLEKYYIALKFYLIDNFIYDAESFLGYEDNSDYINYGVDPLICDSTPAKIDTNFSPLNELLGKLTNSWHETMDRQKKIEEARFSHIFQDINPKIRAWLVKEVEENGCYVKQSVWRNIKTDYISIDEPSDNSDYILQVKIVSDNKENIKFVEKRYQDKLKNHNFYQEQIKMFNKIYKSKP